MAQNSRNLSCGLRKDRTASRSSFSSSSSLYSVQAGKPPPTSPAPRLLDEFAREFGGTMMEDGKRAAAAPECSRDQLGWVYNNGFCYLFTR